MTEKLLMPKYLTKELAGLAVEVALTAITESIDPKIPILSDDMESVDCHIVVLVPGRKDWREGMGVDWASPWSVPVVKPVILLDRSVGDRDNWKHRFDIVARSKAIQLWTNSNDGRNAVIPHLLCAGDTQFRGGVCRNGIIVTCSGFDECIDQLVSGIVADTLIALAQRAFDKDEGRQEGGESFLVLGG